MSQNITTNLDVLIFFIKHQNYYKTIIEACNNAGSYPPNNKLYYFTFANLENKQRYKLSAYQILYAIRRMYLYQNEKQYYSDPIVRQYIQAYQGQYNIFLKNKYVYQSFRKAYVQAYYYSRIYNQIQNILKYKNLGLQGNFIFNVPHYLFPHVPHDQLIKTYSKQEILTLYQSIIEIR